ncbi:MAG: hypothetical protein OEU84_00540 [Xanthomonadales bacterium]|nr:hypothetical protein [Xanthomonadales bacterium]MDH4018064.1 hypothetical protein [Xanthomonadales bacterium]
MKTSQVLLSIVFVSLLISPALAKESREDKQARLDAACEVERQKKIAPIRQQVIEECVASKELSDRKECERFYADYGERTGRKAALFYELPECVTAFEFQQGGGN